VLEALGKVADLHKKVFYAIHVEKQALNTADLVAAWAQKQGIDKAKFTELYNSFPINLKARKATQLQDAFKVDGVPALGVDGRYYTSGSLAGTMARALLVTDHLLTLARKTRAPAAKAK
jgi:thiol:disulfide interchange protein DsbA